MSKNKIESEIPPRVGLFGGTFNPIHKGHLQVANDVLRQYNLEWIYFIPSAQPPHKKSKSLADAHDRLTMVRLALKDHPCLRACDIEIRRAGLSYTVDTLRYFKTKQEPGGQLYFILGADAFLEINTWRSYQHLFELAAMIVVPRPPHAPFGADLRRTLETFAQRHIDLGYQLETDGKKLSHPHKLSIHIAGVSPMDIASTRIRQTIRKKQSADQWLTPEVSGYILDRGLYSNEYENGH